MNNPSFILLFFKLVRMNLSGGQLVNAQGMKPGQTAVIGGQTVRFTTATPSMMATGNQVHKSILWLVL